jgi:hypothetical protein
LALVFAAIIKQVVLMIFGEPENNLQRGEMNIWTLLPPIILTAILVALSFFVPLSLQSLLQSATMKI